jgi:hypothetical protein
MQFSPPKADQISPENTFNSSADYADFADYVCRHPSEENRRNLRNLRINCGFPAALCVDHLDDRACRNAPQAGEG